MFIATGMLLPLVDIIKVCVCVHNIHIHTTFLVMFEHICVFFKSWLRVGNCEDFILQSNTVFSVFY